MMYTVAQRLATGVRGSLGVARSRNRRNRIRANRLPPAKSQSKTAGQRSSRSYFHSDVDYSSYSRFNAELIADALESVFALIKTNICYINSV